MKNSRQANILLNTQRHTVTCRQKKVAGVIKSVVLISIGLFFIIFWTQNANATSQHSPKKKHAASGQKNLSAVLNLPESDGPLRVYASFHLMNLNEIDDEEETFEFSGVFTLTWKDKRQAYNPEVAGVDEKIYQGEFQFNELSPSWYPQVILANASGLYEKSATILRIKPDGACTLIETINAVAETKLDLRRYPFDVQHLEAVFEVLGFDANEVVLETVETPVTGNQSIIRVPQWELANYEGAARLMTSPYTGKHDVSSAFVMTLDVKRQSMFMLRLVVMPLFLIVVLSWSVFWMDRSSLGDRMNVSFVGILTAVAYQIVVDDILPNISYVTLMNSFLNVSFWLMCATVIVNLVVASADKKGNRQLGDRIDRLCRWIFPLLYAGAISLSMFIFYI